jgi:hypothetical protein
MRRDWPLVAAGLAVVLLAVVLGLLTIALVTVRRGLAGPPRRP